MAETGTETPHEAPQVRMQVLAQYIRDMSFENVVAQKGLNGGEITPDIQVQIGLDARKRPIDHQYEIILKFNIEFEEQGRRRQAVPDGNRIWRDLPCRGRAGRSDCIRS